MEDNQCPQEPGAGKEGQYRVFISYAHEDRELAEKLAAMLEKEKGVNPVWDCHITPGMPFTDAIKGMISHSHLFVPLVTESSQQRPWINQETGYAMALNIPVLPIVTTDRPEYMTAQLQAIKAKPDLSDLAATLAPLDLLSLIAPPAARPVAMMEVAQWPEDRTRLMAEYANHVVDMGYHGMLRQRGAFSSFCIPDADIGDAVWKRREGKVHRGSYFHQLQRAERQALELHARHQGCSLIVDPTLVLKSNGEAARRARLETLRDALAGLRPERGQVRVLTSTLARAANLTIVGDWFVAESQIPQPGEGYRQTVFNWHAPTVLGWVKRFDEQFDYLLNEQARGDESIIGPEPAQVIAYLEEIIATLPAAR